jgi:hypothetical protein
VVKDLAKEYWADSKRGIPDWQHFYCNGFHLPLQKALYGVPVTRNVEKAIAVSPGSNDCLEILSIGPGMEHV